MKSKLFEEKPETTRTSEARWIRIFPDQGRGYQLYDALQARYIGRILFDADDNRNPKTAPWHYTNLPLGLSHDAFVKTVRERDNNVYTAILKTEAQLKR